MTAAGAAATPEPPVRLSGVSHHFGEGPLRKTVLSDLSVEIRAGEIVIVTGPSGSGKTTALTLIGALRTGQEGSIRVLSEELVGADASALLRVRRRIGYIFQHHNLLPALTATQNVQLGLLEPGLARSESRKRASAMLDAVGLGEFGHALPQSLSGGQQQRVAIARALIRQPRIILADEPTAALDKKTGRDVVALMERLARDQGVTVVLVTHDNRILDIADRILHLEDGRLSTFSDAVLSNTRHMMAMLAENIRKGDLTSRVIDMPVETFSELLQAVTDEARNFLRLSEDASIGAFESMLERVLESFTRKVGEILSADRASVWLVDEQRGELWSKVARGAAGEPVEIRIPRGAGIAGNVAETGETANVPDAYADPRFDPSADRETGYRTRCMLCIPLLNSEGHVFGVAQVLNRRDGAPFDRDDERAFREFMNSVGVLLESWWRMAQRERPGRSGSETAEVPR